MNQNVLKNKNFILLFLGAFVSNIGGVFYNFAVGFHILTITNKDAKIQGIYLAVCGVMFLIATPIGGVLADRFNKAKIVYLTDFLRGIIILISGYAIYLFTKVSNELTVLFITAIFLNVIGAIFSPAASSLVRFIVDDNQLQQAHSYFSILNSIQSIIGIILAGILYSVININTLFFLVGILYLLSGISELFIRYKYKKAESTITLKVIFSDYKEGIQYLKTQRAVVTLLYGILFVNFFCSPIFSNGTSYFVKVYLVDNYLFSNFLTPELWSSVFSVSVSIGSLITALVISFKQDKGNYGKRIKKWIIIIAAIIAAVAISFNILVLLYNEINQYLIIYTFFMLLLGIAVVCFNIPCSTSIQRVVDKEKLAKVQSLITIGSMGLIPIASLVAGLIISTIGLGMLYIVCASGISIAVIFISLSKSINKMGIKEESIKKEIALE